MVTFDSQGHARLTDFQVEPTGGGTLTLEVARTPEGRLRGILHEPYQFHRGHDFGGEPVVLTVLPCLTYQQEAEGLVRDNCDRSDAWQSVTSDHVPDYALELAIADMPAGASGWTVPWAFRRSADGNFFINKGFAVKRSGGGTLQMMVSRDDNNSLHARCATTADSGGDISNARVVPDADQNQYLPIQVSCQGS